MGLLPSYAPQPLSLRSLYLTPVPQTGQGYIRPAPPPPLGQRLADTITHGLQNAGVGNRQAQRLGGKIDGALEALTPVGNIVQGFQAGQALRNGHLLAGGLGAALAMLPVAKGMFGHLPEPSILNMPRVPTAEEMARLSRVSNVPLDQVRAGNRLQWARFNAGDYGEPLVRGYADKPLAVQMDNGEFVLLDGNHRAALAKHSGAAEMPMHVIPARQYDPANAGRAAKQPSTPELERLLAQLTRP